MKKLWKKGLPLILSGMMVFTLLPGTVFADSTAGSGSTDTGKIATLADEVVFAAVKLDKSEMTLETGSTADLSISAEAGYTVTSVAWTTSDAAIATVAGKASGTEGAVSTIGTVASVAAGETTVSAEIAYTHEVTDAEGGGSSTENGKVTQTCVVKVTEKETETVTPERTCTVDYKEQSDTVSYSGNWDKLDTEGVFSLNYEIMKDASGNQILDFSKLIDTMNEYAGDYGFKEYPLQPGDSNYFEITITNNTDKDYTYKEDSFSLATANTEGMNDLYNVLGYDGQLLPKTFVGAMSKSLPIQKLLGVSSSGKVTFDKIVSIYDKLKENGYEGDSALTEYMLNYYSNLYPKEDGSKYVSISELADLKPAAIVNMQGGMANAQYEITNAQLQSVTNPLLKKCIYVVSSKGSEPTDKITVQIKWPEEQLMAASYNLFYSTLYPFEYSSEAIDSKEFSKAINNSASDFCQTHGLAQYADKESSLYNDTNKCFKDTIATLKAGASVTIHMAWGINGLWTNNAYQLYDLSFYNTIELEPVVGSITGTVFNDATRDNAYIADEGSSDTVLSGSNITLQKQTSTTADDGTTVTTAWEAVSGAAITTGADGTFTFDNLEPGTYRVVSTMPTSMNNRCSVSDAATGNDFSMNGSDYMSPEITVAGGDSHTVYAGYYYYTAPSNPGGGGGGGGGSTTIVDEEPPLAELNKEDHFAYVIGYPEGDVRPAGDITRAEVATIFFRMLTDSSRTEIWSTTNDYSDVSATNWFNNAVSTLSNDNILKGYEDGTFGANLNITRAEFATIAARFDTTATNPDATFFSDVSGHWAETAINRAAALGYITGYEDGTFKPNQYITRAEAMTLINRVLGRDTITEAGLLADMITWPDNTTDKWYYTAVQEATNSHYYELDESSNETWTEMREVRDWEAFEKEWSNSNSAANPGEVTGTTAS